MSSPTHNWPRRDAYFWQEAPMLRLVIPLALGIFWYDWWPNLARMSIAFMALVFAVASFAIFSHLRSRNGGVAAGRALFLHVALFGLGYSLAGFSDVRTHPHWAGHSITTTDAHLVVLEEPQEKARIWRVPARFIAGIEDARLKRVLGGSFLNFYKSRGPFPFHEGDTLMVAAAGWTPIQNSGNPFAFDYARFLQRKSTHFQQFLAVEEAEQIGAAAPSQAGWIERINKASIATLRRFVEDRAALGILEAMLLGYETDFDPELRQAYAETGVIHIVAISGGHVAMLFAVVNGVLFFLRRRGGRVFRMLLGIALMWVYVLVAGAPPSAVRSAVMFSVIALAFLMRREDSALNTLCAAAFALLCYEPMWLFQVGFQLSFAAVLSLILFYPPISRWMWSRWWILNVVWKVVSASLAAQILTAPISVYYFHNFPLWFLVANVFAWIMLGLFGLIGGLSILAFSWAPPIASLLAALVSGLVKSFNWIILNLQKGNPVSWSHLQLSFGEMLTLYCVIGFASLFLMLRRKLALHAALGSLALFLALLAHDRFVALKQDRLLVYNTSRHIFIDRITGQRHVPIFADTAWEAAGRAPRDSRIGYRAWKTSAVADGSAVKVVGGKIVLVLNDALEFSAPAPFSVDYLIVNRPLKGLSPALLRRQFSPGLIVIGGNHRRWQALAWKDSCAATNQPFHSTGIDGGLTIE